MNFDALAVGIFGCAREFHVASGLGRNAVQFGHYFPEILCPKVFFTGFRGL